MYRVLTAAQARAVEERAVAEQGVSLATLMQRAGAAVADEIAERVPEGDIVVLAGPGNNGGDGWVAARELHAGGRDGARALACASPSELSGHRGRRGARRDRRGRARGARPPSRRPPQRSATPPASSTRCSASGLRRAARAARGVGRGGECERRLPARGRRAHRGRRRHRARPSAPSIDADCTVTFTAPKRGLLVYPGAGVRRRDRRRRHRHRAEPRRRRSRARDLDRRGVRRAPAAAGRRRAQGLARPRARDRGLGHVPGRGGARGARRDARGRGLRHARGARRRSCAIAHAHLLAVPVVGLPQGKTQAFASAAASKLAAAGARVRRGRARPGPHAGRWRRRDRALHRRRDRTSRSSSTPTRSTRSSTRRASSPRARRRPCSRRTPASSAGCWERAATAVQRDRIAASASARDAQRGGRAQGRGHGDQRRGTAGHQRVGHAGAGDRRHRRRARRHHRRVARAGTRAARGGGARAYLHGRAGEAAASALTPICVTAEDVPEYLPVAVGELLGGW